MLCKLAWGNVRRAGRDYLVYLLTLTLGVTVFYAFNTISMQVDIAGIDEEGLAQVMGSMLGDLTYFLAGVMAFLMVYANNFIMKRRKKEFGLYQVLGMGRGRVATIMALETVIVSVVAFVAGIVLGMGLSQLMTFFTASLFKTQIANFHFFFSVHAFNLTLACMLVMFVLTLLLNLRAVRRTKLIELMGAERRNESIKTRNPWIAIAIFAVGVVLVGVAYYRLLRDGFPLTATGQQAARGHEPVWYYDRYGYRGHLCPVLGTLGHAHQAAAEPAQRVLARPQHVYRAPACGQGQHGVLFDGRHRDAPVFGHHLGDVRYVDCQCDERKPGAL